MASEQDVQDVIRTLIAEGVGEGQEGMRRIAETILNRAEQRGISPAEVVRQRAQYTGYSNPGPAAVRAQSDPRAISAAQAAWQLAQGPDDPTGGANHYFNPSIVRPSWAQSMTPTGEYGGHAFYTDRPVPPRNIPNVPPSPASLSPTGAAVRQMTSPSGGNGDLQTALNQMATRERNRVTPQMRRPELPPMGTPNVASLYQGIYPQQQQDVNAVVGGLQQDSTLAAALARRNQPDLTYPGAINASVGGLSQDAALAAALQARSQPVTQLPRLDVPSKNDAARRAALSIGSNQTFAGQERNPPIGGVGLPPATRSVPTTTVRPSNPMSYAGQERATPSIPFVPRIDPIGAMPSFQGLQDMAAARFDTASPNRLPAGNVKLPQNYGAGVSAGLVAGIGLPSLAPPQIMTAGLKVPAPLMASTTSAPSMGIAQQNIARPAAPPLMAAARPPLNVLVQGSNRATPIAPVPMMRPVQQPMITPQQMMIAAGNAAVSQSGDNSTGNQAQAAAAMASGQAWREAQERKR